MLKNMTYEFCKVETETLKHLFCDCPSVKNIWRELEVWLRPQILLKDTCSSIYVSEYKKFHSISLKFATNTVPCNMESDTTWSYLEPGNSTSGCLVQKRKQNEVKNFL